MSWRDLTPDPNDASAVRARAAALDRAWGPSPPDRLTFLVERCRGRRVLDVGCADHTDAARTEPSFLHARLGEVASSCVGADVNAAAVDQLRGAGFDVHVLDVLDGPGGLTALEPFDVVVAGEIIEHLRDPLALLETAHALLVPGGELVVTTPNPYAPHRVHAGRTRFTWENVDHLFYAFPSGMAELADRAGFELTTVTTTQWDDRALTAKQSLLHWRRALVGRGTVPGPPRRPAWPRYSSPLDVLATWRQWRWGMLGETALYVLRRR